MVSHRTNELWWSRYTEVLCKFCVAERTHTSFVYTPGPVTRTVSLSLSLSLTYPLWRRLLRNTGRFFYRILYTHFLHWFCGEEHKTFLMFKLLLYPFQYHIFVSVIILLDRTKPIKTINNIIKNIINNFYEKSR